MPWTHADTLSRRQFAQAAAALFLPVGLARPSQSSLTAQQVIDRIRTSLGMPWREKTVDGFKAGDPATAVTGIVTTVTATLPVLQKAVTAGNNLVIAQHPVFYTPNDEPGNRAADAVLLAKKAFIEKHRLVIWRFSDHWTARKPDATATALAEALFWTRNRAFGADELYTLHETTFGEVLTHVRDRLAVRGGLRAIGRPDMHVRTVLLSPGATDVAATIARMPRADVIVTGEPREWEAVPYVLDMRTGGLEKGLIAVGRVISEEPGMRACATWIKSFVPEVRVETLAAGDPYWSPSA
jgi:putative NIF3 family GTP cyclohydrolase 1 type 2